MLITLGLGRGGVGRAAGGQGASGDVVELGGLDLQAHAAELLGVVADPDAGFGCEERGEQWVLLLRLVLRRGFLQWQESAAVFQCEHNWPAVSFGRVGEAGVLDGAIAIVSIVILREVGAGTIAEVNSRCEGDGFAPAADYGQTR